MSTATERPREVALVARTVWLDQPVDLLGILPADAGRSVLAWVRRSEGLVGWGRAAGFTASGPDRFTAAAQWWQELVSGSTVHIAPRTEVPAPEAAAPAGGPIVFGSFPFADDSAEVAHLVVPQVVVGRRGDLCWVTTVTASSVVPEVPAAFGDEGLTPSVPPTGPGQVSFADASRSADSWGSAVQEAVARICAGDLDKVVLARDLLATTSAPIDPRWLLHRLAERYDSTWVFSVEGLVGATPELLVRREKGLVTSRVLAGTIRRSGDADRDLALAGSLAHSSKDLEEHEYAVVSVSRALAPHCSSMNLPESPFVLHLANVMHLATDVTGVASDFASSLDLAASLHPTAAVGGTPTSVAVELIPELEAMDRGRYAGPVGWMDVTGDGEWGIALRCGQIDPVDSRAIRLFAGCGVVAGSVADSEIAESVAKLVPMRDALTAADPARG